MRNPFFGTLLYYFLVNKKTTTVPLTLYYSMNSDMTGVKLFLYIITASNTVYLYEYFLYTLITVLLKI